MRASSGSPWQRARFGLAATRHAPMGEAPLDASARPTAAWLWPLLTLLAAVAGGAGSATAPQFYAALARPDWAPPAALFGPVWTLLYATMALASWWVARTRSPWRRPGLVAFALQLVLNAAWSWVFFRGHLGLAALIVIVLMWIALAASAWLFGKARPVSGWLMLPTLAWVTFAGLLNFDLWQRNPGLLG